VDPAHVARVATWQALAELEHTRGNVDGVDALDERRQWARQVARATADVERRPRCVYHERGEQFEDLLRVRRPGRIGRDDQRILKPVRIVRAVVARLKLN
jgi:hypothetical protein